MDVHHLMRLIHDRVSECGEFDCWRIADLLLKEATKQGKVGTTAAHIKNYVEDLQRSVRDMLAGAPEGAQTQVVMMPEEQNDGMHTRVYVYGHEEQGEYMRRYGLPEQSEQSDACSMQTAETRR